MNGALPPSSSETFLTWSAHWRMSSLPTSVEPVKPSLRTIGFEVISRPITGASSASPVTMESTPGGSPALLAQLGHGERRERRLLGRLQHHRAARRRAPGAALRVTIAAGKFQGVIPAVTPTGSFVTRMRRSGVGCGIVSP